MTKEERIQRLRLANAAFEKYQQKFDYESQLQEIEKRKSKFLQHAQTIKLGDKLMKNLFPTISIETTEKERIPKIHRKDLISISDGDNGTLTMTQSSFKSIYKEHKANEIKTF